jgi:hypothetical protein
MCDGFEPGGASIDGRTICFEDDDQRLFWLKGSIALVVRGRIS